MERPLSFPIHTVYKILDSAYRGFLLVLVYGLCTSIAHWLVYILVLQGDFHLQYNVLTIGVGYETEPLLEFYWRH